MNRHIATTTYAGSVAAAILAAVLMSGQARAEGPIEVPPPFVGTLTRAEVQASLAGYGGQGSGYASEWERQQNNAPHGMSSTTRAQVRADYIAARDEVHAMTAEDGGSSYLAGSMKRYPVTTIAGSGMR